MEGGIIGKKQPNGQYPRIDCTPLRKKSSNYYFGLIVAGNNLKVQNIIIENSPSYGIFISGIHNIIDHIITRYNGESGIYANSQSDYNTFNYCYSYRNFLMPNMSHRKDGDGFTIEINSLNNKFNYWLHGTIVKVDLIITVFFFLKELILQKILHIVIQLVGIMEIWMFSLENMTLIMEEN